MTTENINKIVCPCRGASYPRVGVRSPHHVKLTTTKGVALKYNCNASVTSK